MRMNIFKKITKKSYSEVSALCEKEKRKEIYDSLY